MVSGKVVIFSAYSLPAQLGFIAQKATMYNLYV